jgi:hypothetical protein
MMTRWANALAMAVLVVSTATVTAAASDAKKAERAVSGAAHRVSKGYHKQVKDYHLRKARKQARRGDYRKAVRHADKANWHDTAERKQLKQARTKEKANRND